MSAQGDLSGKTTEGSCRPMPALPGSTYNDKAKVYQQKRETSSIVPQAEGKSQPLQHAGGSLGLCLVTPAQRSVPQFSLTLVKSKVYFLPHPFLLTQGVSTVVHHC